MRVDRRPAPTRPRSEEGFVSVWTVLAASGVFLLFLGLVYDGGSVMNDRLSAHRAAEQAARAGADQIAGIRSGAEQVDIADAQRAASAVLADAGWSGQVEVNGLDVTVTVLSATPTLFLNAVGVDSLRVDEHAAATAIRSEIG
jgi:Flp pilus assembly protein TadG